MTPVISTTGSRNIATRVLIAVSKSRRDADRIRDADGEWRHQRHRCSRDL